MRENFVCRILTKILFSFIEVLYPWKHTSHSWYIRMFVINSFDLEGLWAFQCRIWIYGLSQLLVSIVVTLCFDSYCWRWLEVPLAFLPNLYNLRLTVGCHDFRSVALLTACFVCVQAGILIAAMMKILVSLSAP